jgi:heme exporter protein A
MTTLLEFENLAVARGDRVLLRGLSGRVQEGEVLHIRGPNGAGKTSLLEVLSGLREPEEGTIARAADPEASHWIGHRNGLHGALSPYENLAYWCALQDLPSSGVRGALREFELGAVADRPCRQLSAGQNRRAALSRLAIVRRPLWFLDEPLSALDAAGIQHWLALPPSPPHQGGAAIITSHQLLPDTFAGLRTLELQSMAARGAA